MVKPIVYGINASPFVRAVLLVADAIGLEIEFKQLDPHKGEHKTEEFLKKNPQHTIPILEDGGKCIWDSHAIITYLTSKYAKNDSMYPKDLYTRAMVDQRLHFDSGVLSPRMFAYSGAVRTQNAEAKEKAITSIVEAYEFLEKFLDNNKYFVGNSLTVADLSILATLSTVNIFVPVDQEKFPKLKGWLQNMTKLPYYGKANQEGLENLIEFFKQITAGQAAS